jgi:hypothetical protein
MLRKAYEMTERFVNVCIRLCKPNTGKNVGNRPAYCESWHLLSYVISGPFVSGCNGQIITCPSFEALWCIEMLLYMSCGVLCVQEVCFILGLWCC